MITVKVWVDKYKSALLLEYASKKECTAAVKRIAKGADVVKITVDGKVIKLPKRA
jgi:hypothetical protein